MSRPIEIPSDRNASGRSLGAEELELLAEVVRSGSLNSTSGTMVRRFERAFAQAVGTRHAIACSSGSLAVQAGVAALDLPPGAEVVTSPVTDFGAITAILYEGARPAFCDVDPRTLMPTAGTIEAAIGSDTAAVIATHLFGRPAEVAAIRDSCRARRLPLLEDAAQALGSLHRGRAPGTFGVLGTFSFQQSKLITSGEGGAVVTDDEELAARVRLFVNKAWPYGAAAPDHRFVAPNGRMTELQAAVLLGQLAKMPDLVARRRRAAHALFTVLSGVAGIGFVSEADGDRDAFWRIALQAEDGVPVDAVAELLAGDGIPHQAHYIGRPAFELEALRKLGFRERRDAFPGVRDGLLRCLVLPWNENIGEPLASWIGARIAAHVGSLEAV